MKTITITQEDFVNASVEAVSDLMKNVPRELIAEISLTSALVISFIAKRLFGEGEKSEGENPPPRQQGPQDA